MVDTTTEFFKYYQGIKGPATSVYRGYYTDKLFIMNFDDPFWFNLEVENYNRLKDFDFIPNLVDVRNRDLTIIFEYSDTNLNHLFYHNIFPSDWYNQVKSTKEDLQNNNFYKLNFYPHTFFYQGDVLKTFDVFAIVNPSDKIPEDKVSSIINDKDRFRFQNGYLDVEYAYNYTIKHNSGNWPRNIQ